MNACTRVRRQVLARLVNAILQQLQQARLIKSLDYSPSPAEWKAERKAWENARCGTPTAIDQLSSLLQSAQHLSDTLLNGVKNDVPISGLLDQLLAAVRQQRRQQNHDQDQSPLQNSDSRSTGGAGADRRLTPVLQSDRVL